MSVYYDNHQGAFGFHEFLGREYIKRPDAVLNRNASSQLFAKPTWLGLRVRTALYGAKSPQDGFFIPIGLGGFTDRLRLWHNRCQQSALN